MSDSVNTRELVLQMLIEINEKHQYSHLVLRDVLSKYQNRREHLLQDLQRELLSI